MKNNVSEEKEIVVNKEVGNEGGGGEPVRHEGPLSEGEDRDDYNGDKFVDREAFDGKWAEKGEEGGGSNEATEEANAAS